MSIRWGGLISGEVYGSPRNPPWDEGIWDTFESHAGKRITCLHWHQPLGEFNLDPANIVKRRGATSLVSYDNSGYSMARIVMGEADAKLEAMGSALARFGDPVKLRLWWEMNGDWYSWGRDPNYTAAFRHAVDTIRPLAPNARFVWCPNVLWSSSEELERWYPGEAYVDWVGVDGYNWGTQWKWPQDVFGPTLDKLASIDDSAPWMICETASAETGGDKALWLKKLLGTWLPKHKRIKELHYFNWNALEGTTRRQWPIESSPAAQAAFKAGIASPYYRSP